jgi:hypothetical protein
MTSTEAQVPQLRIVASTTVHKAWQKKKKKELGKQRKKGVHH